MEDQFEFNEEEPTEEINYVQYNKLDSEEVDKFCEAIRWLKEEEIALDIGFSSLNYRVILVFAKNIELGKNSENKPDS